MWRQSPNHIRSEVIATREQIGGLKGNAEITPSHPIDEFERTVDSLRKRSPMGLLRERDATLFRFVCGTLGVGNIVFMLNHYSNEVRTEAFREIEMWCDVPQTVRRFGVVRGEGAFPMTIDAASPFVSSNWRISDTRSGNVSIEMADARIDRPENPAVAARGANFSIGRAAASLRLDDSAIRQERESFISIR